MKSLALPHSPSNWILAFLTHSPCSTWSSLKPRACKYTGCFLLRCLPGFTHGPIVTILRKLLCPFLALSSPHFSWWELNFLLALWYIPPLVITDVSLVTSKDSLLPSREKENFSHKHLNNFVRPQTKTCSRFACVHLEPRFFFLVYHRHHFMWHSVTQPPIHSTTLFQGILESVIVLISEITWWAKPEANLVLLELPF